MTNSTIVVFFYRSSLPRYLILLLLDSVVMTLLSGLWNEGVGPAVPHSVTLQLLFTIGTHHQMSLVISYASELDLLSSTRRPQLSFMYTWYTKPQIPHLSFVYTRYRLASDRYLGSRPTSSSTSDVNQEGCQAITTTKQQPTAGLPSRQPSAKRWFQSLTATATQPASRLLLPQLVRP